jgi:xylitol oxidase
MGGMTDELVNWAGNIHYRAARFHQPRTVEELQTLVAGSSAVRALGSRHSFNTIADTAGDLVSVRELEQPVLIDRQARTVQVGAGMRYGELMPQLHRAGFALHNTGSLPHISIAGACATGTHGSGNTNGNLATAVSAVQFVRGDGELVRLTRDRDPDRFGGAVLNLGALGIVTSLTLDLQPTYAVRQDVYVGLSFDQLAEHFDDILAAAYSVSVFGAADADQPYRIWLKTRLSDLSADAVSAAPQLFGSVLSPVAQHPIDGLDTAPATQQLGVPGPWFERLPHFRLEFVPSVGDELQSEYLLPRANAVAALTALRTLADELAPLVLVSEIRTVAADELWLSPSYRQDSVALHFTWRRDTAAVGAVLPALEALIEPLGARPHWGKVFTTSPDRLRAQYERLSDFTDQVAEYDPTGKFTNDFLSPILGTR